MKIKTISRTLSSFIFLPSLCSELVSSRNLRPLNTECKCLRCLLNVLPTFMCSGTVKNTVISPNLQVRKFCGKAQFPHGFG